MKLFSPPVNSLNKERRTHSLFRCSAAASFIHLCHLSVSILDDFLSFMTANQTFSLCFDKSFKYPVSGVLLSFCVEMLKMSLQVDLMCCKSVGTDLSMLDIDDLMTEISQLKKEVALLEAKLRERGDPLNGEELEKVSCQSSVCVTDGTSTECQDSVWSVRDQRSEQRSRDTQDSELSLTLLCYTDTQESVCDSNQGDQTSTESLASVCNAGEQQMLQIPLKMCSVKLLDCRNLMEMRGETTAEEQHDDHDEDDDDDIQHDDHDEVDDDDDDVIQHDDHDEDDVIQRDHDVEDVIQHDHDEDDEDVIQHDSDDDDFLPSDANSGSCSDGEMTSTSKECLSAQSLSCITCQKTFSSKGHLARHERKHTEQKFFKCRRCGSSFSTLKEKKLHSEVHRVKKEIQSVKKEVQREKEFCCDQCGKVFFIHSVLKAHVKTHSGEKPFQCSECDKCFRTKGVLVAHERTHTGEKPYKCPHCEKRFNHKPHLKTHVRVHTKERPYQCSECGKTFTRIDTLKSHQKIHSEEKHFQCSYCDKRFLQRSDQIVHERMHTGEKPYLCSHCGMRFYTSGKLSIHQRVHTGEKPYNCDCGKSFSRHDSFVKHQKTHTGERLYNCTLCDKTFAYQDVMKTHQRVHTGEKPYSCSICWERFAYLTSFNAHQKKHAEDIG
ncbi:zinc finger protein 25-like isoform X2 [Myxocyprinus asiaticus]|uniref:zinc finger protein 25-like isoform X1 n=1 Tax=Myxocyprinus asiaticus TaxID=70543 RepID=UPI00222179A7|nr:zinc finger protein 25-like isoform X1 [Myxocyprinus asiaticus]XP_051560113.1 zinc finger protein 25-like isoform X2 [Myxocyprinus asiaticus]